MDAKDDDGAVSGSDQEEMLVRRLGCKKENEQFPGIVEELRRGHCRIWRAPEPIMPHTGWELQLSIELLQPLILLAGSWSDIKPTVR
jgi:hypothetical protein